MLIRALVPPKQPRFVVIRQSRSLSVALRRTPIAVCLLLVGCGAETRDDAQQPAQNVSPQRATVADLAPPETAADKIAVGSAPMHETPEADVPVQQAGDDQPEIGDEHDGLVIKIVDNGDNDSREINIDERFQIVLTNTSERQGEGK